jgi:hypothetical protein
MSVHSFFFLHDNRLPSVAQWQRGLDDAKTSIALDAIADLRSHTGYLPAKYKGEPSGFEWYYGPVADVFGQPPQEIGDRSHAIDFVTHSDMRELICGMLAGAILAKISDGIVFDEESGSFIDGNAALEIARRTETTYL